MSKTYKGSLTLEWYNKQKSILLANESQLNGSEIPAPRINWVNKEEALFYEIDESEGRGLKPYWVDRSDIRVKEARPLIHQKTYKAIPKDRPGSIPGTDTIFEIEESEDDDPTVENILIKGDNLLALNILKKIFDNKPDDEKIKFIYIDPPYNTKKAFKNYDDNLAHSEWLTLMRDRIILLKSILKQDGVIAIHIDDKELPYMKILLDEIFGRENCVTTFIWETDGNSDNQAKFTEIHEYILVYAVREDLVEHPSVIDPNVPDHSKLFKEFIQNTIIKNGPKNPMFEVSIPIGFPAQFEKGIIRKDSVVFPKYNDDLIIEKYQLTNEVIAKSGWSSNQQLKEFNENGFKEVVDTKGQKTTFSLKDTGAIESIKRRNKSYGYVLSILKKMGNPQSTSIELKTKYSIDFDFPKPEFLTSYLINVFSNEGDIIMDSFLGSGTVAAVCSKMKRKWIGVEVGNHVNNIIMRLKGVISGHDDIGISKSLNWKGGGAFKYYHLGPSIITTSEDGNEDFNWSLGAEFLQESLLSSYDYSIVSALPLPEQLYTLPPKIGIQKFGNSKRVAIISLNPPDGDAQTMSFDEVRGLYETIKKALNPNYINIFTNRGIEMATDSKPDDLEIIKVPHAIFAELER